MFKKLLLISALTITSGSVMAACSFDLEGTDQMTFTQKGKAVKNIDVPASCKEFTINLKHVGKMPKSAMGHNVVVAKKSDIAGVLKDGVKAGAANDYIKKGDKRVIAHSKMIGGGESTSVKFVVANAKGADFVCTFPAHGTKMRGTLTVK